MPELAPAAEGDGQEPILKVDNLKTYYEQESKSILSLVGMGKKRYVPPQLVRGGNVKKITLLTAIIGVNPEYQPEGIGKEMMDD